MSDMMQFENTGYAQSKEKSRIGDLLLLAVMFPVTILYHVCAIKLFKEQRQRPYIVMSIAITVSLIVLGLTFAFNTYLPGTFIDIENIRDNSIVSTMFSVLAYVFIGLLWPIGFIVVLPIIAGGMWRAMRFIKQNEAYLHIPNMWCYDWSFVRTPFEKMKKASNIKKLKTDKAWKAGHTPLGISVEENKSRDKIVYRKHKDAKEHTLVVGGTGAGKTYGIMSTVQNSIESGFPVVYVDFKRTNEVATTLSVLAKENGAKFYHFLDAKPEDYDITDSEGLSSYDPFANALNNIPDMLVNMRDYDTNAEHWMQNVREFTMAFHKMLRESNPKYFRDDDGTILIPVKRGEIIKWIRAIENIDVLADAYINTRKDKGLERDRKIETIVAAIKKPSTALNMAKDTIYGALGNLANSSFSEYLDMKNKDKYRYIDIYESFKPGKGDVILFSFSADSQKLFASGFGSLIMQDLSNISARRREEGMKNDVHIYVDEFQAIPAENITSLTEKSRGSGLATTFISQNLAQVEKSGGSALLNSLINTCSNFFIYNGSDETAAKQISGILGAKPQLSARLSAPTKHRTIWESIVEIVEDYDSDNMSVNKEMLPAISTDIIQGLQRPQPPEPPEMLAINKASLFANGKNFIKVRAYVSDRIGQLIDLSESKNKSRNEQSHSTVEMTNMFTVNDVKSDNEFDIDNQQDFDLSLDDTYTNTGEYNVDNDYDANSDYSGYNSVNTIQTPVSDIENRDEIKPRRVVKKKPKRSFDLEEEMNSNFSSEVKKKPKNPQRPGDINTKKKDMLNRFDY